MLQTAGNWSYYVENLHKFDAEKRAKRLQQIEQAKAALIAVPNEGNLAALRKANSAKPPAIEAGILDAVCTLGIDESDFMSDLGAIREFMRLQDVVKVGGELEQAEQERFRLEGEVQKSADELKKRGVFHYLEDGEHSVLFGRYNNAIELQRVLEKDRNRYKQMRQWPITKAIDSLNGDIYRPRKPLAGQPKNKG
ncbi:hypothetical protein ACFL02_01800 [Planctomycetota bacterium]